jgi:hypothetical protein
MYFSEILMCVNVLPYLLGKYNEGHGILGSLLLSFQKVSM